MSVRRPFAVVTALVLVGSIMPVTAAQAAPLPLFDTTVEVSPPGSPDSLLGGIAYVSASTGLVVRLGEPQPVDVTATLIAGSTDVASCTVVALAVLPTCFLDIAGEFSAGANDVTVRFTAESESADYTGTVFVVPSASPTVRIEWQDAAGNWVDGSGLGLPLFGETTLRCVVTNNSNAPIIFGNFAGEVSDGPASTTVQITGTLEVGETGTYAVWSGTVRSLSADCGGSVILRSGEFIGSSNGGGLIPLGGSITIDRPPEPGQTIAITGDSITPPIISTFDVLLDGVEVAGSPVSISGPDFDFSLDVAIPASLAIGSHAIEIVGTYEGRDIVIAQFVFDVAAPQLAATGSASVAPLGIAALALMASAALLLTARWRPRTASALAGR